MTDQQTSCVVRGNTFFGTFETLERGEDTAVRVRYNGDHREAKLDGFPAEVVAHLLLRELVVLDVEISLSPRRPVMPRTAPGPALNRT